MLSSAASLSLVFVLSSQVAIQRRAFDEKTVWAKIRPSVVMLMQNEGATGLAAAIDASGLFVAHRSVVPSSILQAKLPDGRMVTVTLISADETSQLVLLSSADVRPGDVSPISFSVSAVQKGTPVVGVLSSGPIEFEVVSGNRIGVIEPTKRLLPLTELRFELPGTSVSGALLFTTDGSFLGPIGATLADAEPVKGSSLVKEGVGGPQPGTLGFNNLQYAPNNLTVAYALSPAVVERILVGFLSPSRKVEYPSVGIFCTNAPGGGALIQSVVDGSTGKKAGLRPGDVISKVGDTRIETQFDFARTLWNYQVGESIKLIVRRDNVDLHFGMRVGTTR